MRRGLLSGSTLISVAVLAVLVVIMYVHHIRNIPTVRESFSTIVADLIYVYHDGPDSRNFTPTWAKFTDDYRDTLEGVGVRPHKFKDTDAEVQSYNLKLYPVILLTGPEHGAIQAKLTGSRTVPALGDFVHTTYPSFDRKKYRSS